MNVAEEAVKTVEERGAVYGSVNEDFSKVINAAIDLHINPHNGPAHHALYMILVKLARLTESPTHRDSLVDIVGYALTYEQIVFPEKPLWTPYGEPTGEPEPTGVKNGFGI